MSIKALRSDCVYSNTVKPQLTGVYFNNFSKSINKLKFIIIEVQVINQAFLKWCNIDLKPRLYSWFDPWSPQLDIDEVAAMTKSGENVAKLENCTYFAIQKNDQPVHDIEKNNTHTLVEANYSSLNFQFFC